MLVTLDQHDRVVAVNARFLDGTGHDRDAVLARVFWVDLLAVGSRVFYYTQLAPVLELDGRLEEVMVDLRTADGGRVPALMNASRHTDADGVMLSTSVALMTVRDRRAFENRLRQARNDAEQAHRDAELARHDAEQARLEAERALRAEAHARSRLELLAQANTALASSLDVEIALYRLARTLTAWLADWCLIHVPDPANPSTVHWAATHTDVAHQSDIERLADLLPARRRAGSPLDQVLHGGAAALLAHLSDDQRDGLAGDDESRALFATLGLTSLIVVPAAVRGTQVAAITLGRGHQRAAFTADDLADVTDLAARTGIVIDNLRRSAREHSNSIALQHALLTTPPTAAGFEIVTRYLPATTGNEVGGDWYDALLLHDGTPLVVIGDVVGHDIHAAAAMGQLRGIIRTLAYTTTGTPSEILTQADATARGVGVDVLATAVVGHLHSGPAGDTIVQWSSAGHPPPLLITASGVTVLHATPDRILGLPGELARPRHDHTHVLHPGDTVVLYTDGLVERTDDTLDNGIANIASAVASTAGLRLDEVCDAILQARCGDTRDDIALLAIQLSQANDT